MIVLALQSMVVMLGVLLCIPLLLDLSGAVRLGRAATAMWDVAFVGLVVLTSALVVTVAY